MVKDNQLGGILLQNATLYLYSLFAYETKSGSFSEIIKESEILRKHYFGKLSFLKVGHRVTDENIKIVNVKIQSENGDNQREINLTVDVK